MPKIIANVREKILDYTRKALLAGDMQSLTVGNIAAHCGIASGTVFNYFPSKEVIFATVMLEDWQQALTQMRAECEQAETVFAGLDAVYRGISQFCGRYAAAWHGYRMDFRFRADWRERHNQLRSQLCGVLQPLLRRFAPGREERFSAFLAENLLLYAQDETLSFSDWKEVVRPLFE